MKLTYRQAIELEIKGLDKVYDIAGALRDTAIGVEKEVFNAIRGQVGDVASQLRQLNNRMADHRASMPLEGNYEIHITLEDL